MVNKRELLVWIETLDDESCIGIDEGGLCLREILSNDTLGEAYFEIGGIPKAIEEGVAYICDYCDGSGKQISSVPGMLTYEPCEECHGVGTWSRR